MITAPPKTANEFKIMNVTRVSGKASLASCITFFNVTKPSMIPEIPEE